jgi:DNA-binding SARP family transcriptional activator
VSYLLLFRGRPHNREVLADALWGEVAAMQSRKYLRQTLWQLHGSMERGPGRPSLLLADAEWIQVNPVFPLWLDTAELESALARTRDTPGEEIDDLSFAALTRVVQLYRGELLAGWYQDWCVYERERFKAIYLAVLEKLLAYCEAHGRAEEGLEYGRMILGQDHAHERTHRRMMRLHWLAGDRTAAIRQFDRCVAYLRTELGVEPAESTLALYETIRRPPGPASQDATDGDGRDPAVLATLRELRGTLAQSTSLLDRLLRLLKSD